jgi:hypothetical protein
MLTGKWKMKLSEYIKQALTELEGHTDEVTLAICVDENLNVVADGWNQIKITVTNKKK